MAKMEEHENPLFKNFKYLDVDKDIVNRIGRFD